jgi:hypothetical protein
MTAKLNRIKSALRESVEIAEQQVPGHPDNPVFCKANPKDKALLTAIEGLEWVFDYTDWCADGAPDASTHDKVCNEIASETKATLSSITSTWPDA